MQVTVDNLDQATAQNVFETIARHLLAQNKQSRNNEGLCCYRGEEGSMCAAGVLIPNEKYDPKMDNVKSTAWCFIADRYSFSRNHDGLIGGLQYIHDGWAPYEWPEKLIDFAQSRNLNADFVLEYVK